MRSIPLWLLCACTDPVDKGGGGPGGQVETGETGLDYTDADGDGYFAYEDCDDQNPEIRPGKIEICDSIDNNCDDEIDEGVTSTYYLDADGDGYGDADAPTVACACPDGASPVGGDCDDADGANAPGLSERCDGQDNNCDGNADEGLPADDYETYYTDADADGYGDPTAPVVACRLPDGASTDARDCDDADPSTYPGAPELDSDDVVNNCDACWPDGACSLDEADARILGEADDDGAGAALGAAGDVDRDGLPDLLVGAPSAGGGAAYVVSGRAVGDLGLGDARAALVGAASGDRAGSALGHVADLDADERAELVVGAPGADDGGRDGGAVFLVLGDVTGTRDLSLADGAWISENAGDNAGAALWAGDLDDDGADSVVIGAPRWPDYGDQGAIYVVSAETGEVDLSGVDTRWTGATDGDAAGQALGAGDLDGDGLLDLLIGAPGEDSGGRDAGAVVLVLGPLEAGGALVDADGLWVGEAAGDALGSAVAAAGDLDGDGTYDLVAGAPGCDRRDDEAGAAYALSGTSGGEVATGALALWTGEDDGDALGSAVAAAGDPDGDGQADLWLGAPYNTADAAYAGAAYAVWGSARGEVGLPDGAVRFAGAGREDGAGTAVQGVGDVDGDGLSDGLIGAPAVDAGGSDAGAAYLVWGVAF